MDFEVKIKNGRSLVKVVGPRGLYWTAQMTESGRSWPMTHGINSTFKKIENERSLNQKRRLEFDETGRSFGHN